MNVYLDIDGVLLKKDNTPAEGVIEFLKNVTENHDCYWLTTHGRDGSLEHLMQYLKPKLPEACWAYLELIKPTVWDVLKTEGIDFSKEFVWFDDNLMESEKKVLKEKDSLNSFRLVELNIYPNQLTKEYIKV